MSYASCELEKTIFEIKEQSLGESGSLSVTCFRALHLRSAGLWKGRSAHLRRVSVEPSSGLLASAGQRRTLQSAARCKWAPGGLSVETC